MTRMSHCCAGQRRRRQAPAHGEARRAIRGGGRGRVETYIQSGNVVFEAKAAEAKSIAATVEKAIVAQCGFSAPLVLRNATEWRRILADNPYLAEGEQHLHLVVWNKAVGPDRLGKLDPGRSPPDEFQPPAPAASISGFRTASRARS